MPEIESKKNTPKHRIESYSEQREFPEKPLLAKYTDFRRYLQDFYNYKRALSAKSIRPYSYGNFSAAADIKSPSYLKLVIEGQRNLSQKTIMKFAKALQLDKESTMEFQSLVEYGQAKEPLDRNQALKSLMTIRSDQQLKGGRINSDVWDKFSSWVTWVIYNIADQEGAEFRPSHLQKLLRGRVSLDRIKKAYDNLLESGDLIYNKNSGEIKKGRLPTNNSQNISIEMVRKLQSELIYLSLESLFQDNPVDREFGAVTFALTREEFEKMKFELRQLKKRYFKDIATKRESSKGEKVYQLNIQLFPVTDP